MYEILPEIWKLMNRLMTSIFLLTTNLSWWLMKQEKVLTVLTVSNFIEFDLFRVDSSLFQKKIDNYSSFQKKVSMRCAICFIAHLIK